MKREPFIGKKIMVFTAHPDDEMIAAGTMYENHKAGGETTLVCATYGEKGKSHLAGPVSDAALKKMRKAELLAAAKILRVDTVLFLGFPDAKVRDHRKKLYEKCLPLAERARPDYILSFGPDGMSAHWDHITVGSVALKVARKLKIPTYAFTVSDEFKRTGRVETLLGRRKFGSYAGIPKHRKWNAKVKVEIAVKHRAMRSHRSQFGSSGPFGNLPGKAFSAMFGFEYFVKERIS